jgi:hypothetical protein
MFLNPLSGWLSFDLETAEVVPRTWATGLVPDLTLDHLRDPDP